MEASVVKVTVLSIGLLVALPCGAQESSSQPASNGSSIEQTIKAPSGDASEQNATEGTNAGGGLIGVYGGGGKVGEGGVYTGMFDTGTLRHPDGLGLMLELGVAAKTPAKTTDGVLALNLQQVFNVDKHSTDLTKNHAFLFLNGGYTRFILTGNAADYGGGVIWRLPGTAAEFKEARFEYREYYIAGYGRQQEVRVSWELGGPSMF
jgi:hypothetical protein